MNKREIVRVIAEHAKESMMIAFRAIIIGLDARRVRGKVYSNLSIPDLLPAIPIIPILFDDCVYFDLRLVPGDNVDTPFVGVNVNSTIWRKRPGLVDLTGYLCEGRRYERKGKYQKCEHEIRFFHADGPRRFKIGVGCMIPYVSGTSEVSRETGQRVGV
jgi:hypothetical protein